MFFGIHHDDGPIVLRRIDGFRGFEPPRQTVRASGDEEIVESLLRAIGGGGNADGLDVRPGFRQRFGEEAFGPLHIRVLDKVRIELDEYASTLPRDGGQIRNELAFARSRRHPSGVCSANR